MVNICTRPFIFPSHRWHQIDIYAFLLYLLTGVKDYLFVSFIHLHFLSTWFIFGMDGNQLTHYFALCIKPWLVFLALHGLCYEVFTCLYFITALNLNQNFIKNDCWNIIKGRSHCLQYFLLLLFNTWAFLRVQTNLRLFFSLEDYS